MSDLGPFATHYVDLIRKQQDRMFEREVWGLFAPDRGGYLDPAMRFRYSITTIPYSTAFYIKASDLEDSKMSDFPNNKTLDTMLADAKRGMSTANGWTMVTTHMLERLVAQAKTGNANTYAAAVLTDKERQLGEARRARDTYNRERDVARSEVELVRAERDAAQGTLQNVQAARDHINGKLVSTERERDDARAARDNVQAARDYINGKLVSTERERDDARAARDCFRSERDAAREELRRVREELDVTRRSLHSTAERLGEFERGGFVQLQSTVVAQLRSQVEHLDKERANNFADMTKFRNQRDALQAKIDDYKKATAAL